MPAPRAAQRPPGRRAPRAGPAPARPQATAPRAPLATAPIPGCARADDRLPPGSTPRSGAALRSATPLPARSAEAIAAGSPEAPEPRPPSAPTPSPAPCRPSVAWPLPRSPTPPRPRDRRPPSPRRPAPPVPSRSPAPAPAPRGVCAGRRVPRTAGPAVPPRSRSRSSRSTISDLVLTPAPGKFAANPLIRNDLYPYLVLRVSHDQFERNPQKTKGLFAEHVLRFIPGNLPQHAPLRRIEHALGQPLPQPSTPEVGRIPRAPPRLALHPPRLLALLPLTCTLTVPDPLVREEPPSADATRPLRAFPAHAEA